MEIGARQTLSKTIRPSVGVLTPVTVFSVVHRRTQKAQNLNDQLLSTSHNHLMQQIPLPW